MRVPDVETDLLNRAREGDLAALDKLLLSVQPAIYNLAVRMLGNREDARDACQEILLKIATHLGSFRGDSAFSTWVYRIAANHVMRARTRSKESPEISFESFDAKLAAGLEFGNQSASDRVLLPEEKVEAQQIALNCTQGMLLCMDREHRIAYILDVVFGLSSEQAADVLLINPDAYRKRLSRARARFQEFMTQSCGLVGEHAKCRCARQLPAVRAIAKQKREATGAGIMASPQELRHADNEMQNLMRMSDAVAVFRGHPSYQAPGAIIQAIRAVVKAY